MSIAYIGLGSNLGDCRNQLENALSEMQKVGLIVEKVSPFIETEPYGVLNQPVFLNGVCSVQTHLSPQKLLHILLDIEQRLGRIRTIHWGPRAIDLDLLLYDQQIITDPNLTVPHPDMKNRLFVLAPLANIAPTLIHPQLKKTIQQLLEELQTSSTS